MTKTGKQEKRVCEAVYSDEIFGVPVRRQATQVCAAKLGHMYLAATVPQ